MDNLTHSLVGLTAARAGVEKLSPGATAVCLLAANAPDADIVVLAFGDRWTFLQHHRGITHAIIGVIALAFLLPLLFYAVDLLWSRLRKQPPTMRLKGLLLASFVASATHPLLDWTNSYGIRFLLPWNERWFYGDLVFIVDPLMWLILGGASFLLSANTRSGKFLWAGVAAILTFLIIASERSNSLPNPLLITVLWILTLTALVVLYVKKAGQRWGSKIALVAFAAALRSWGLAWLAPSTTVPHRGEGSQK